jgi:hypothetical protein
MLDALQLFDGLKPHNRRSSHRAEHGSARSFGEVIHGFDCESVFRLFWFMIVESYEQSGDFLDQGDTAPNSRFNYRYRSPN